MAEAAGRGRQKAAIVLLVESCEQVVVWIGTVVVVWVEEQGTTTMVLVGTPFVAIAACSVIECHPWYKRRAFYYASYINIILSLYTYSLRDGRRKTVLRCTKARG